MSTSSHEQQFTEVCTLVAKGHTPQEQQAVMDIIFQRYPDFTEPARNLQIIMDSIGIMGRTRNRDTLESRYQLALRMQQEMFDSLPFSVSLEQRARQAQTIVEVYEAALQALPEKKPARARRGAGV